MSALRALVIACLLLAAGSVGAQQTQQVGDYTVYYSALPSGFLTPEIAREYGVLRSRTRGVLLVSIKRGAAPVEARIEARVGPGGGRLQPLALRSVRTGEIVSYLGSFAIADGESRQFSLEITPANGKSFTLSFSQEFFDAD